MNSQQIRAEAQTIFDQMQTVRQQRERLNPEGITSIMRATVDELASHIEMVTRHGIMNWKKIEYGTTEDQVIKIASVAAKSKKRGAGARALSAKYGKDVAEKIIQKHTGKHFSLKS
jgi:hypothetical protein